MHHRTKIRNYAIQLLRDTVDIGERIFPNRPSPIFLEEVPCGLVYFDSEPVDIIVGDKYSPKQYQRNLRLNVDFLMTESIQPGTDPNEGQKTEDKLDFFSWQAEQALADDWTFSKLLDDDDPCKKSGLLLGLRIVDAVPYTIDTGSERRIVAQRTQFELPYDSDAYKNYRFKTFQEYDIKFNRVGWDENTIDPTLLEAEGNVGG